MENSIDQTNQSNQPSLTDNKLESSIINSHEFTAPRIVNMTPVAYRLARKPNGELMLQGMYRWTQGALYGDYWEEIPIVDL